MLKWTQREVAVADLKPFERNPRKISAEDFERLKESLRKFGYHTPIKAMPDLRIIGGHQRRKALQELDIKKIVVWVPERDLTDEEFRELLVKDNLPFGSFDFDILSADFEAEELLAWGMPENWLGISPEGEPKPPKEEEYHGQFSVLVSCGTEEEQLAALDALLALGYNVKALTA